MSPSRRCPSAGHRRRNLDHGHTVPIGRPWIRGWSTPMAEALNGTFNAALIHRSGPWKTRTQTEIAIYEWISWYNNARIHTCIGDVPPIEYEHRYYAQTITPASIVAT